MKPQQVAQVKKAGRGWLIVRNSATLADSDYEHIANEIADALNKRQAYSKLIEALRTSQAVLTKRGMPSQHDLLGAAHSNAALLRELGKAYPW